MVIALDVGTSSARAGMYDRTGEPVPGAFHQIAYAPTTTPDGGVEHDAGRLLEAAATCLDAVLAGRRGAVLGVGVGTFWHSLLGFDAAGQPVTPVYTWADSRSDADAALLGDALDAPALHARTGCHLHSSYWPAKLRWVARAQPGLARRAARWGSVGELLGLALFGEGVTSLSMASGTGLLDQERLDWDAEALAAAGIAPGQLFRLRDRTEPQHGLTMPWARRWPALRSVPWFPAIGDGAAGSVGSGCTTPARVALNLGTSAALRVVGESVPPPPRGLWRYRLDRRHAVLGGATSEGGNVVAWCRQVLSLPDGDALDDAVAAQPADGHGLVVLPFLAGERAPGWRGRRRALLAGLSLDTTAVEIVRAALEAVALRLALVYERLAPCAAAGHAVVASGGAVRSRAWAQIITDALGRPVHWAADAEATSRGLAVLALDALGVRPALAERPLPAGDTLEPDAARHARYRAALVRQQRLDERV